MRIDEAIGGEGRLKEEFEHRRVRETKEVGTSIERAINEEQAVRIL